MTTLGNALLRPMFTRPNNTPILLLTGRGELLPGFYDNRDPFDPFPWRVLEPGCEDGLQGYRADEPFRGWFPLAAALPVGGVA